MFHSASKFSALFWVRCTLLRHTGWELYHHGSYVPAWPAEEEVMSDELHVTAWKTVLIRKLAG